MPDYYRSIMEKLRDIGVISIEELGDLAKKFGSEKTIAAVCLLNEGVITLGEAIDGLECGGNFFIASNKIKRR